jgi:HSP20 family protein
MERSTGAPETERRKTMLTRYSSPFAGDDALRALFNFGNLWGSLTPDIPAVVAPQMDIMEKEHALEFVCDLPGARPEDVDVTLQGGVLTIHATRKTDYSGATLHRAERYSGEFSRSFQLGDGYDAEGISATLNNGILVVSVPKLPAAQPKKIPVSLGMETTNKQLGAGEQHNTAS